MCQSEFSVRKLLKLYVQIVFYAVAILSIFLITGHEKFTLMKLFSCFAIRDMSDNFISCFLLFYLFIPFLNLLIKNISQKQLKYLVVLLLVCYCILPSIPKFFHLSFNYVSWFICIYFTSAYVRLYGKWNISHKSWGIITLLLILISSISIVGMEIIYKYGYCTQVYAPYYFVVDSNKLLPMALGFTSFMYFKDLKMPHSKLINAIGSTTFGVLLIHANSDAMRQWLWRETINSVGHFTDTAVFSMGYAIIAVIIIFIVCSGIDRLRGMFIEPYLIKSFKPVLNRFKSQFNK